MKGDCMNIQSQRWKEVRMPDTRRFQIRGPGAVNKLLGSGKLGSGGYHVLVDQQVLVAECQSCLINTTTSNLHKLSQYPEPSPSTSSCDFLRHPTSPQCPASQYPVPSTQNPVSLLFSGHRFRTPEVIFQSSVIIVFEYSRIRAA